MDSDDRDHRRPRRGVTIPVDGVTPAGLPALARRIEDLGYDDLWSEEATGLDGITPLALAAAVTERLRLVTGVVNPYTRGRALLAQTAAALALASADRFVLGLGSSSRFLVEDANGMHLEAPVATLERTVGYLRTALSGGRVDGGFRLASVPAAPVPIVVAALRPRMLRLAAEVADGSVSAFLPRSGVAQVRSELGPDTELAARVFVFLGEETDAIARARRLFAAYGSSPYYAAFYEWLGWSDAIRPMVQAWRSGDRTRAVDLVPTDLLQEIVVVGAPEEQRERLDALHSAGVDTTVLALYGTPGQIDTALADLAPSPEENG